MGSGQQSGSSWQVAIRGILHGLIFMLFHILSDWEDVMKNILMNFQMTEMWGSGKRAMHRNFTKYKINAKSWPWHIRCIGVDWD